MRERYESFDPLPEPVAPFARHLHPVLDGGFCGSRIAPEEQVSPCLARILPPGTHGRGRHGKRNTRSCVGGC